MIDWNELYKKMENPAYCECCDKVREDQLVLDHICSECYAVIHEEENKECPGVNKDCLNCEYGHLCDGDKGQYKEV